MSTIEITDHSPADSDISLGKARAWSEIHGRNLGDNTRVVPMGKVIDAALAEGTKYHDQLENRDIQDQHPKYAITGLEDDLLEIDSSLSALGDSIGSINNALLAKADIVDGKVPDSQLPNYINGKYTTDSIDGLDADRFFDSTYRIYVTGSSLSGFPVTDGPFFFDVNIDTENNAVRQIITIPGTSATHYRTGTLSYDSGTGEYTATWSAWIALGSGGGGGDGTFDHREMLYRDAAGAHPDTAVTHGSGSTVYAEIENVKTDVSAKANASDVNSALALKADIASPNFTGTVSVNGATVDDMAFVALPPNDGKKYAMQGTGAWAEESSGIADAPVNSIAYMRKNGAWVDGSYSTIKDLGAVNAVTIDTTYGDSVSVSPTGNLTITIANLGSTVSKLTTIAISPTASITVTWSYSGSGGVTWTSNTTLDSVSSGGMAIANIWIYKGRCLLTQILPVS